MLAISAQNQHGIFEKVLRGKDGRLYAVCFAVFDVDGQIRARVISASLVNTLDGTCSKEDSSCTLLMGGCQTTEEFFEFTPKDYVSPFVSELDFLVNQLARAPSVLI